MVSIEIETTKKSLFYLLAQSVSVYPTSNVGTLVSYNFIKIIAPRRLPPDIARSNTGGLIVTIESLIIFLIIGAVAGWLAGMIVKGFGFGLIGNCLVGILGAFIAGFLLPLLGIAIGGGIIAAIINATIGAVILLVIIGFVKK